MEHSAIRELLSLQVVAGCLSGLRDFAPSAAFDMERTDRDPAGPRFRPLFATPQNAPNLSAMSASSWVCKVSDCTNCPLLLNLKVSSSLIRFAIAYERT